MLYIVFLDGAFILALMLLRRFVELLAPSLTASSLFNSSATLVFGLVLFTLYYLLILMLYSFIKFFVLHLIQNTIAPRELRMERFFSFYGLNISLVGIFVAVAGVLLYAFNAAKQPYQMMVFLFMAIPYLLLLFVMLNTAHSIFYAKECSVWRTIKQTFSFTFTRAHKYGPIVGWCALLILLFIIVLFIPGMLIRSIAQSNPALYVSLYGQFSIVVGIVGWVALYIVTAVSRLAFYIVVGELDAPSA